MVEIDQVEYWRERVEHFGELLEEAKAEFAKAEEVRAAATPPFQVGDLVKPKAWGFPCHWEVLACSRMEGRWVVLVERDYGVEPMLAEHMELEPKTFPSAGQKWHRKEDGGKPQRADNHGTILSVDGDHVKVQYGDGNTNLLDRTLVTTWFEEAA